MAHVSAQTHDIAEYQVVLHATQQLQAPAAALHRGSGTAGTCRSRVKNRDVAQTQGRAVAEDHAAQHAKFSDIRMAEAFKQMEIQLQTR
ncbi:hypothetical protein PC120_g24055 [Phytophthora cactorum]|nr:hypothetical protein PC120_g24055 [Phytophthora cactorum]